MTDLKGLIADVEGALRFAKAEVQATLKYHPVDDFCFRPDEYPVIKSINDALTRLSQLREAVPQGLDEIVSAFRKDFSWSVKQYKTIPLGERLKANQAAALLSQIMEKKNDH